MDMVEHAARREHLLDALKRAPAKGVERCPCGKQFFWTDPAARDEWVREHAHAEPT